MTAFVRLLALSLIFFPLSACGMKKMPEYTHNYNPDPRKRYEVTMLIDGAPGRFKEINGFADYEVLDDSCVPLTDPISGVKQNPMQSIQLNYDAVSDNEYKAIFYTDLLKDEDYFGLGICKWSFTAVRFVLNTEATVFTPYMMERKITDGAEKTTYYTDLEFFESRIPGMVITGTADSSEFGDELKDKIFSITLRIKEDF